MVSRKLSEFEKYLKTIVLADGKTAQQGCEVGAYCVVNKLLEVAEAWCDVDVSSEGQVTMGDYASAAELFVYLRNWVGKK